MWCTTRFNFGSTALFNLYQRHATSCSELLLYADDTCLIFQHRYIKTLEEHLNRYFSTMVDCVADNRLSVHFGEDETKSILFSPKHRLKSIGQRDISYKDVKIKQYSKVTYLGCVLDECQTGESMACRFAQKLPQN